MSTIPDGLRGRPFTTAEAEALGVSRKRLRGSAFQLLHPGHGVWSTADTPQTLEFLLAADRLVLPPDAAVSHVTGLRLYLPKDLRDLPLTPRHWSTNSPAQRRTAKIVLHRRQSRLHPRHLEPIPLLGPDRCLVDAAISLSLAEIVQVGDALIRAGHTSPEVFNTFAWGRSLHGVRRSRQSGWRMREKAGSFTETQARLAMSICGLPDPEVNGPIHTSGRAQPWHGDLVLRPWRIVVEYDGWHHERSAGQRRVDIVRRESIEAEGWLVVVLTAEDLRSVPTLVGRVWRALVKRGYDGRPPVYSRADLEELHRHPKAARPLSPHLL